ncbi:bile acid:sodium symporter [Rubritepida flocculans]|uniref:bile acid:sodium symporter n=1 Tax=Rubritepida flocculans TaxID=182403 RepID=UPI0004196685|nr:bile acid:sodium symporter [Rubritepida flocculans]
MTWPDRAALERGQVWLYLAATLCGLLAGAVAPGLAGAAEALLWPVLALLLLATFTQVPLTHIAQAARDARLLAALLIGNFLLVPLLVAALWPLVPADPAIRLGVLLVLLLPCTDWSITFTHLARGNTAGLIAAAPVLLLLQMLLLPAYLWPFLGSGELGALPAGRLLAVFGLLIAAPLALAWLLERWAERSPGGAGVVRAMGAAPVPLLAVVVFLIALGQGGVLAGALAGLVAVAGVFVLFLLGALGLALGLTRGLRLEAGSGRTVLFSLGTRNSFVVLPLALALPAEWAVAALVIVLQSLVELLGMLVYLRLAPRLLPAAR